MLSDKVIWEKACNSIKQYVNDASFQSWIEPLKLVAVDRQSYQITVEVPDDFSREWVQTRYAPVFNGIIKDILNNDHYQVSFIVNNKANLLN